MIKRKVSSHFDRAAQRYNDSADLQYAIGARLVASLAPHFTTTSPKVMDIGVGAGRLSRWLCECVSPDLFVGVDIAPSMLDQARLEVTLPGAYWLQADFDQLPIETHSFDLIFSNCSLQWSADLPAVLHRMISLVRPGGILAFSYFVPPTLSELAAAGRAVLNVDLVNALPAPFAWPTWAKQHHLTILSAQQHTLIKSTVSFEGLLLFLRSTGANYHSAQRASTVTVSQWRALKKYYEQHYSLEGKVYASFAATSVVVKKNDD